MQLGFRPNSFVQLDHMEDCMSKRFEDARVLVTGATRGTGAACTNVFLAEGARVAINGRTDGSANGLIADIDPAFCQHFLDISKAQRKSKIEPDGVLDDHWRNSKAGIGNLAHSIAISCLH
jgi:NAD(P)-dependent dehydrogenase (short-subunit alcohol dehydrogenase family)